MQRDPAIEKPYGKAFSCGLFLIQHVFPVKANDQSRGHCAKHQIKERESPSPVFGARTEESEDGAGTGSAIPFTVMVFSFPFFSSTATDDGGSVRFPSLTIPIRETSPVSDHIKIYGIHGFISTGNARLHESVNALGKPVDFFAALPVAQVFAVCT